MKAGAKDTAAESAGRFIDQFRAFERALNGEASSSLHALRRQALARFTKQGFPTQHDEEWRFTNLLPVMGIPFSPATQPAPATLSMGDIEALPLPETGGPRMVFVNGQFAPELSTLAGLPEGIVLESLRAVLAARPDEVLPLLDTVATADRNPFAALNTSFLTDGAFLRVPRGVTLEQAVHLVFLTVPANAPIVTFPRVLALAGEGSSVKLVETHLTVGSGDSLSNAVTEIVAGRNARVEHARIGMDGGRAFRFSNIFADQERDSAVTTHAFSLGGALARNDVHLRLNGEGAEGHLNGLSLARGEQHIDNHTTIEHARPHCSSREVYKGIWADASHGVFSGRIIVRKDAQKTDAKQSNGNLLLSDKAVIDSKPQLEILADDVKCTHGATVGRLDEDAAFYLRSRGIPRRTAESILMYAFAGEIVERVTIDQLRAHLDAAIHHRLLND